MVRNEDLGSYGTTQKTMRKKILLVDDSPFFLKALSDALSVDFHVETASSGEKAINLLKEIDSAKPGDIGPFDLVITDLEMTGLSGYDVSQFIRKQKQEQQVYTSHHAHRKGHYARGSPRAWLRSIYSEDQPGEGCFYDSDSFVKVISNSLGHLVTK